MALSPELRKLVTVSKERYAVAPATGIIPFATDEMDPREALVWSVACMINEAATGPAINPHELAEMIVDKVLPKK